MYFPVFETLFCKYYEYWGFYILNKFCGHHKQKGLIRPLTHNFLKFPAMVNCWYIKPAAILCCVVSLCRIQINCIISCIANFLMVESRSPDDNTLNCSIVNNSSERLIQQEIIGHVVFDDNIRRGDSLTNLLPISAFISTSSCAASTFSRYIFKALQVSLCPLSVDVRNKFFTAFCWLPSVLGEMTPQRTNWKVLSFWQVNDFKRKLAES